MHNFKSLDRGRALMTMDESASLRCGTVPFGTGIVCHAVHSFDVRSRVLVVQAGIGSVQQASPFLFTFVLGVL